jgi:polysaccharide pyruvyl transferase WcaK-like protein
MKKRNPRVVLYGQFGTGNAGNDGSLQAALYHFRNNQPDADFLCVCTGPEEISRRMGIKAVPIGPSYIHHNDSSGGSSKSRVRKIWYRLTSEISFWLNNPSTFQPGDQFIVVGTGAVDDMGVRHPWNSPYELYKWCKTAKMGGAQVLFVSVGVGPIRNSISRFIMLNALRLADYRSYRDLSSFDFLHSVGFDTSADLLYPDIVFSLPLEEYTSSAQNHEVARKVGLGLINYFGWQNDIHHGEGIHQEYISKIRHFVTWLLDEGYTLRIVTSDVFDQKTVQEIVDYVGASGNNLWLNKLSVEQVESIDDLLFQLNNTDIVIASRYHTVLCSLLLGIPVISLGYHEKNVALMREMGLEANCQHIETFTVEQLIDQFKSCITGDRQSVTERIKQQCDRYRQQLDEQYCNIFAQNKLDQSRISEKHLIDS